MLFHEKLHKLRREAGLSQEALAEKLDTSRQAVSKWENGNGFPETEKLLLLSGVFGVSVDYLLRDTAEDEPGADTGYYVSKEMAEGYFANQRRWLRLFTAGLAVLILSIGAFMKYEPGRQNPLFLIVLVALGGFLALKGLVSADKKYEVLGKEPLLFDSVYLKELRALSQRIKRGYTPLLIGAMVLFLMSIMGLRLGADTAIDGLPPAYQQIAVVTLAVSVAVLFYTGTLLESYQLLAENEAHTSSFFYRLNKKRKKILDNCLK